MVFRHRTAEGEGEKSKAERIQGGVAKHGREVDDMINIGRRVWLALPQEAVLREWLVVVVAPCSEIRVGVRLLVSREKQDDISKSTPMNRPEQTTHVLIYSAVGKSSGSQP